MAPFRSCLATAACLLFAFVSSPSLASDEARCPIVDGATPSLGAVDAALRLAFIRETMRDQAHRARQWSYAWAAAGLGLATSSYTRAALAKTNNDRVDPIVGGTTSLFIPAAILVQPLEVMAHQATLEERLALGSAFRTSNDLCGALAESERLLATSAANEASSAGLFAHLFVIAGNGAVALFLGLGYGHWEGALVNGGGGLLISELQILTQPTGAIVALDQYRRSEVTRPSTAKAGAQLQWRPLIGQDVAGIALTGAF